MAVTQKVTLYNNKFTVPPVINAVQNDTDRQVEAYFGDFTLQVGMTGKLSFIRSDGTHYEVSATLSTANNTATAKLDQALTQAGVTQAQLKITDSGNVGSTFTFMIKVQPDVAGISVPQDGWSAQEFDQRLTDAENAIDAVEEDVADLQDKEYDYAPVITDTASGSIATFSDGADSYPLKECVVNIEAVQSGSGDPSPTNVRPITGWSEAKVTRTGKNLSTKTSQNNTVLASIKNGVTYTFSFKSTGTVGFNLKKNNNSGSIVANQALASGTNRYVVFTSDEDCDLYLNGFGEAGVPFSSVTSDYQLEVGSAPTDYIPYVGNAYTISLGDTRYGGTLDVRRGKLRVTHGYKDINDFSTLTDWLSAGGLHIAEIAGTYTANASSVCSMLKQKIINQAWASTTECYAIEAGKIRIYTTETTLANFKAKFAQLQLVYELATPIEVDLTPTEITTLLGTNNVWADCGDIEVEYCADTKRYIQKLISQLA